MDKDTKLLLHFGKESSTAESGHRLAFLQQFVNELSEIADFKEGKKYAVSFQFAMHPGCALDTYELHVREIPEGEIERVEGWHGPIGPHRNLRWKENFTLPTEPYPADPWALFEEYSERIEVESIEAGFEMEMAYAKAKAEDFAGDWTVERWFWIEGMYRHLCIVHHKEGSLNYYVDGVSRPEDPHGR